MPGGITSSLNLFPAESRPLITHLRLFGKEVVRDVLFISLGISCHWQHSVCAGCFCKLQPWAPGGRRGSWRMGYELKVGHRHF